MPRPASAGPPRRRPFPPPRHAARGRPQVEPEPGPTVGDPTRLRQLVTLLLDNAIHHSPRGGEVSVVIRPRGERIVLTVDDHGHGIRPEDLPRVFDRFWRAADAPSGGTGLGLAIARWIAERHGGTIEAGNVPGGGARFEVRLPARGPDAGAGPAAPGASATSARVIGET